MKLGDLVEVKIGMPDADFWLSRVNSLLLVGRPRREMCSGSDIGVRVVRTDILLPAYLYYVFEHLWQSGYWQRLAHGRGDRRSITTQMVRSIPLEQR